MLNIDFSFLKGLHQPAPRYTSYPVIVDWNESDASKALIALEKIRDHQEPLSLYFHIPFCHSMCLYCGCAVVINRKEDVVKKYIDALIQEMKLIFQFIGKRKVARIHFGGGTPSRLSQQQFSYLFSHIHQFYDLSESLEIAIEFDPRSLRDDPHKPQFLKNLGFNRVSLGIQDTQTEVQEAVRRRQSREESFRAFETFQDLGFKSINVDLIYGLPKQTKTSFQKTIKDILMMRPDRIALFSFASVPWIKPHQKAIPSQDLPSIEERFSIYSYSRHTLIKHGYLAIGLDHFALKEDSLAIAFQNKTLIRNFQGYSLPPEEDLIGLGMSATSFIRGIYLQNDKQLTSYQDKIFSNHLATIKSKILSEDDQIRKWVIHKLMCTFLVSKQEFFELFGYHFDTYFAASQDRLISMEQTGLIHNSPSSLRVTPLGELFVRVIVTAFDAYFLANAEHTPRFSKSI